MNVLQCLNTLCELLSLGLPLDSEFEDSRIFGLISETPLHLISSNRELFLQVIQALRAHLSKSHGALSNKHLLEEVLPLIRQKKVLKQAFTPHEAKALRQRFFGLALSEFTIYRPLLGAEMLDELASVQLGPFRVDFLRNLDFGEIAKPESLSKLDKSTILIGVTEKAQDIEAAEELASKRFRQFELIFAFCMGAGLRESFVHVGILNYADPRMREHYVFGADGRLVRLGSAWGRGIHTFIFGDSQFPRVDERPLLLLFELVSSANSQFRRRILQSVEWTGQAILDPNPASALVKAMVALEVLFSENQRGIIAPSIMSNIADSCAYVLGRSASHAAKIEREIKVLYGLRSSVVHAGTDDIVDSSVSRVVTIVRNVIFTLLFERTFQSYTTMNDLSRHLRSLKYSGIKDL